MAVRTARSPGSIKALSVRLSKEKPEGIVIVTHRGADVDALASAFGIQEILLQIIPSIRLAIHSVGRLPLKSRGLVDFLDLEVNEEEPKVSETSWVLLVDTGGWSTTGIPRDRLAVARHRILVDHHAVTDSDLYDIAVHYPFTSTSEIVLEMFDVLECNMEGRVATALLAGVITDTAGLREANDETLRHLCELALRGADISKAWEVISRETSRDEMIAKLKAAQRMKILKMGELVGVITEVGSFHSSVASSLVRLGADLAVVFSREAQGSKASLRASKRFSDVSSSDLGVLSTELAGELGGHGGGHIRAAALSSAKDVRESLVVAEKFLTKHLSH